MSARQYASRRPTASHAAPPRTQTLGTYTATRPRGFCDWRPQARTRALLEQVDGILEEYREHLPLIARQVFYRLVGRNGYSKDEQAYERLLYVLNRARRAGMIPFEALRDDGATELVPRGFSGTAEFLSAVTNTARRYRRDRQVAQPYAIEVWCEAAGMAPQLARVAHEYGIPVYSSSGFDSLTVKHDAALRILARTVPTVVLHVGDFDPSGVAIFDSAAEDVAALAAGFDEPCHGVEFRRVAVTPEQIERFGLSEAPAKKGDRRGDWQGGTVQAEALAPSDLAAELRDAIEDLIDPDLLAQTLASEEHEREQLSGRFTEWCEELES